MNEPMQVRSYARWGDDFARMAHALLAGVIAVGSSACGSTSTDATVAPSPARCAVTATPDPTTFPANGGSGSLVVTTDRECSWSVTSPDSWIALAPPTQGRGNGRVRYTVSPNPVASARSGTLVLGSQSTGVTQEAASCRFDIDPRSVLAAAAEQTATINVQVATGCAWTARADAPWIAVLEGSQGSGSGRVKIRIAPNPTGDGRSGSLGIAGARVDVRQSASACSYAVDPAESETGPGQVDGRVSVRTAAGCEWTVASDQPWLTVETASGSGPGEFRYHATPNTTASKRVGHLSFTGGVFTLTQSGCSYSIQPTNASFPARGGSGSFTVQTQAACTWSAESSSPWLQVTSGNQGVGNGSVSYALGSNDINVARTGIIVIAAHDYVVSQEAENEVAGLVGSVEGACPAKRFTVRGERIRTTKETHYERGSCGAIQTGVSVSVKGIVGTDGVLKAIEVDF